MNQKTYEWEATIQPVDKGGAFVPFPYDLRAEFGKDGVINTHGYRLFG